MSRYRRIKKLLILSGEEEPMYDKLLDGRDVKEVAFYPAPRMRKPTSAETSALAGTTHTWKLGDRYWKLAAEHYGDATKWWVIAKFNYKPTEAHVKAGDILVIPKPLSAALAVFKI